MQHINYLIIKHFRPRTAYIFLFISLITGFCACKDSGSGPDVSGIQATFRVYRLDQDIARLDTARPGAGLRQLADKYPDFLSFYLDTLMGFGIRGNYADDAPAIRNNLRTFLTHKDYRGLFDTVARHFPDTRAIDEPLTDGFRHMKYYFPQYKVPDVIYFVSGLNNWSAITYGDHIIGIGLDMALGRDYPFYQSVQLPDYVIRNLTPKAMPVSVFRAIYTSDHPFINENRTLLDMMVQRGKEQYFLRRMLPAVPDSVRLGFTATQLDWCRNNEAGIYNFFIKGNMLYETSLQKVLRYVTDGPQATGMPPESPGNVGTFIGWQIVEAYVRQHPQLKIGEVLALQDAQQVLQDARYKPR